MNLTLYQSLKVVQGIRTKVCFDAALKLDDLYIFIDVTHIPTIRDLIHDIKERFLIDDDIKVILYECALHETENILVLADVKEIQITPVPKETPLNHPSSELTEDKFVDEIDQPRKLSNAEKENSLSCKRRRSNFHSICTQVAKFPVTTVNEIDEIKSSYNTEEHHLQNAEWDRFDVDENEKNAIERFVEKKRKRRKRKHSKKAKDECEDLDEFQNTGHFERSAVVPTVQNNVCKPRQHIYFEDKPDELENERELIKPANDFVNDTINRVNNLRIESHQSKEISPVRESSPGSYNMEVENIKQTQTEIKNSEFTFIKKFRKHLWKYSDTDTNQHQYYDSYKSDYRNVMTSIDMSTNVSVNESFFNKYKFEQYMLSSFAPTGDTNQSWLTTLLMRKELQIPERYDIEFSNSSSQECSSIIPTVVENQSLGAEVEQVRVVTNERDYNENDCEILMQKKIVGDTIYIRRGCENWRILTELDSVDQLEPLTEPKENQCITFQIVYLSQNLCPKVSKLFCATVISCNEETQTVRLTISSSFIESLVKDCGEDSMLPDDIKWIMDNAYEIPLIAMKNIRLLM